MSRNARPEDPIIDRIAASKRAEVEGLRPRAAQLRAAAEDAPPARPFRAALRQPGVVSVIAEYKRRSPSAGSMGEGRLPAQVARAYERGGAAAVSVLTDGPYFGGSLDDLRAARAATTLPVLRKDFVADALQVWEARAAGADAVLLIVRMLDDARLRDHVALAGELGIAALVEVHDATELERALAAEPGLVGINNRDLGTFRTDLDVALTLAHRVPEEVVLVAESGIRSGDDVARLGEAGVDAVLVGESLMRSADVRVATRELGGRPRSSRARA